MNGWRSISSCSWIHWRTMATMILLTKHTGILYIWFIVQIVTANWLAKFQDSGFVYYLEFLEASDIYFKARRFLEKCFFFYHNSEIFLILSFSSHPVQLLQIEWSLDIDKDKGQTIWSLRGGGVGRIEKKISCRAVTTKKKSCNTDGHEKKMPTQIARQKKKFLPSQEMLYGKDITQEI